MPWTPKWRSGGSPRESCDRETLVGLETVTTATEGSGARSSRFTRISQRSTRPTRLLRKARIRIRSQSARRFVSFGPDANYSTRRRSSSDQQQRAVRTGGKQAAQIASIYYESIASLTNGGDLVVLVNDVAENGFSWHQFLYLLPAMAYLPQGTTTIVLRVSGKGAKGIREIRIFSQSRSSTESTVAGRIEETAETCGRRAERARGGQNPRAGCEKNTRTENASQVGCPPHWYN